MSLLLVLLLVWAGLLVGAVVAGSALGLVARRADDANDLDLARALERRRTATARLREQSRETARRGACLPVPAELDVPGGVHGARVR